MTLREMGVAFFQARKPFLEPSTIEEYWHSFRTKVDPDLGTLPLSEITRERVETWLADVLQRRSWHAANKALRSLRLVLDLAAEWEPIPVNSARSVKMPKRPPTPPAVKQVLDEEQLRALFAATKRPRVETMMRAAGEAGLRRGEVVGLMWPDIDLQARRILVARAIWQKPKGRRRRKGERGPRPGAPPERIVGQPKAGRSRRIAMSGTFAARLAAWYEASVVEGGASAKGYVWPGRDGGPMDLYTPGRALGRVLTRAGLVDAESKPLVTFHGLRHTAASIMLARNVPLLLVSRQLGHADPNVTARIYAHLLSDAQLDQAAAVFDDRELALRVEELAEDDLSH